MWQNFQWLGVQQFDLQFRSLLLCFDWLFLNLYQGSYHRAALGRRYWGFLFIFLIWVVRLILFQLLFCSYGRKKFALDATVLGDSCLVRWLLSLRGLYLTCLSLELTDIKDHPFVSLLIPVSQTSSSTRAALINHHKIILIGNAQLFDAFCSGINAVKVCTFFKDWSQLDDVRRPMLFQDKVINVIRL